MGLPPFLRRPRAVVGVTASIDAARLSLSLAAWASALAFFSAAACCWAGVEGGRPAQAMLATSRPAISRAALIAGCRPGWVFLK
jgi:hypothetical protein